MNSSFNLNSTKHLMDNEERNVTNREYLFILQYICVFLIVIPFVIELTKWILQKIGCLFEKLFNSIYLVKKVHRRHAVSKDDDEEARIFLANELTVQSILKSSQSQPSQSVQSILPISTEQLEGSKTNGLKKEEASQDIFKLPYKQYDTYGRAYSLASDKQQYNILNFFKNKANEQIIRPILRQNSNKSANCNATVSDLLDMKAEYDSLYQEFIDKKILKNKSDVDLLIKTIKNFESFHEHDNCSNYEEEEQR